MTSPRAFSVAAVFLCAVWAASGVTLASTCKCDIEGVVEGDLAGSCGLPNALGAFDDGTSWSYPINNELDCWRQFDDCIPDSRCCPLGVPGWFVCTETPLGPGCTIEMRCGSECCALLPSRSPRTTACPDGSSLTFHVMTCP